MRAALIAVAVLAFANPLSAATTFVLTPGASNTGVPFDFTVRAMDGSGNTDTAYAGTIHFTSSDLAAVLPSDYTFTPADLGVHTFSATLHGDHTLHTITATDTATSSITGSAGVLVKDPNHVIYLQVIIPQYPIREQAQAFELRALNRDQQLVPGYRGTVHFTPGDNNDDPSVEVPLDYTFTEADAGKHTFNVTFHRGYVREFRVFDDGDAQGNAEVNVQCPDVTLTATNNGPVCAGSPATLTAFTNSPNPQFTWRPRKYPGPSEWFGPQVVVTFGVIWDVSMMDIDTSCLAVASTTIQYERGPEISTPETATGDFTATIANDPTGPFTDIQWAVVHGTLVSGQGTQTVTIHPDDGISQVDLTVTATRTSTSCRAGDSAYTRIVALPLSATITTEPRVCPNTTGRTASVPDAGAGATYHWTLSGGTLVSGQGTPSIVYDASAPGIIHITAYVQRYPYGITGEADVLVAGPSANVTADALVCRDTEATIHVALQGTPPFAIQWSDGVEQTGIGGFTTTRTVTPEESAWYSIVHVADASCESDSTATTFITVGDQPEVLQQPASVTIARDQTARLSVVASGANLRYFWYEGQSGDKRKLVASGSPSFTTPRLTHTTSYWVEILNDCGTTASKTASVHVSSRQRSVRH